MNKSPLGKEGHFSYQLSVVSYQLSVVKKLRLNNEHTIKIWQSRKNNGSTEVKSQKSKVKSNKSFFYNQ
ncbi:MAG: hypothetical protein F6K39_14775 [Okeania sp. SIO3B3]|nr:hypothetical protein [Okeania sp. SIO3B3]